MVTRYPDFQSMVDAAQSAINRWAEYKPDEVKEKDWLQKMLNILKEKKHVTILTKAGNLVDVSQIAGTFYYASFFDVYNNVHRFNVDVKPVETKELKNTLRYD